MRSNLLWVFVFIAFFCLGSPLLSAEQELAFPDPETTISMDFQDAGLKDVLKIFSIQSGLNFIASEGVQDRKLTLYLDKTPIKEAMDKIFKANNLSYELDQDSNIFIVKDWGKPTTETLTKIFYLKHHSVSNSSIKKEVGSSLGGGMAGAIITSIRDVLTAAGKISEDSRTNSLIITDVPSVFPRIEQIIAKLDIPVSQVLIDVEMLDVSKNTVDKMGFQWDQVSGKPFTLLMPNASLKKTAEFFMGNVALRGAETISAGTAGAFVFGNKFAQTLDYLRTQTDTKYLARPRLLTLNNETAEISITKDEVVGTKQQTTQNSGGLAPTVSTEFIRSTDLPLTKEGTGIFLRVTPQINTETNEITMVINPKSSITTASAIQVTGAGTQSDAEVRSTKSIVKVRDGETVVLGGLIHTDKVVTTAKLPILGDIPILGMLFRHKNQTKDVDRELLIFITPHIVKDVNSELVQGSRKVALPVREQALGPVADRRSVINSSLNSFDRMK